jgi:hypothetical protein
MFYYFLSFKFSGEKPESEFEYVCSITKKSEKLAFFDKEVNPELEDFFLTTLAHALPSYVINFLDYHYTKHNKLHPGKEVDFICFVEDQIKNLDEPVFDGDFWFPRFDISSSRFKTLHNWIESKKNELKKVEITGLQIPGADSITDEGIKEYCEGYYKEIKNEIEFKKQHLPPKQFQEFIVENLTKFVTLIENYERDQRGQGYNKNRDMVIQSYHLTLPLWQNEVQSGNDRIADSSGNTSNKILWNGSPALLVHFIREFVEKGYVQPPNFGAEWSYTALAKLCLEHFDVKNNKGKTVSKEYFERAMRNPGAIVEAKKSKIVIPPLSEIA